MTILDAVIDQLCGRIADRSAGLGRRVEARALGVHDRSPYMALGPSGRTVSPNGSCRLLRARDGWVALNLARPEDVELLPAWLGIDVLTEAAWPEVERAAARLGTADLLAQAVLLGLPAAKVAEAEADREEPPRLKLGTGVARTDGPLKVLDMSALWAGPLCGAVFAALGAEVTRLESLGRPDPTRSTTPAFYEHLNGEKAELALDLADPGDRAALWRQVAASDVLITSARPRAFAGLGLDPDAVFTARPGLVWVAVTGHGWFGEAGGRVGFGDDTAAAGGLVGWTEAGAPFFLGDALSDPVTGLAAAASALQAVAEGGGMLVDAAMSRCAATAAASGLVGAA